MWEFHPQRPVQLLRRLEITKQPDYLPVAVASTCLSLSIETYYQVIYRSEDRDGEGCIEIRCLSLQNPAKSWSVWESVTWEDGILGGICWKLTDDGEYIVTVATASRVYFFTDKREFGEMKEEYWTSGGRCLIFEVDIFLQPLIPGMTAQYATRLIHSTERTISVLVFVSLNSQLHLFKLAISPHDQVVKICSKTGICQWNFCAKGALLAWSMGKKLMTSHCCEDECGETSNNGRISVFKTWFAREKRSLKQLVWEFGGAIVDCWDPASRS